MKTIEGKKYTCPKCGCGGNDLLEENSIDCHFCGVIDLRLGGAYQDGFEAGQKSREKERLFNKAEWEHLYRLVKHDNYTGDYYGNKDQYYRRGKRIYKKLQLIKSLSLTKEST